jgi:hypothetical protein
MNQDEQQLDLLAIFHYVVAGLTAFFSCFPIIHVSVGVAMILGAFNDGKNPPPAFVGWLFAIFGSLLVLLGWALAACIFAAGRNLKRRRSRMFCLVMAGIECMFMPYGTVLGVFTIIVLMRESVQKLFAGRDLDA